MYKFDMHTQLIFILKIIRLYDGIVLYDGCHFTMRYIHLYLFFKLNILYILDGFFIQLFNI